MANKKTNKFAAVDTAAKEVKEAPVQAAAEAAAKTEEKVPAVQAEPVKAEETQSKPKAETATKAPAKAAPKKAEYKPAEAAPAAAEKLVIEFPSANYESGEVVSKCKAAFSAAYPEEKLTSIEVYINVSERRAYYVANGKAEGKYIEL
ncbi:MAG: DUF6465 family protein [Oscillospiraceae bacterium]|nr:DUF6465 family protein [Oscillospiraceae bacterium]